INGMMIVGALLSVAGWGWWLIVTEPWRNFDNWSKPLYTGHDDHHAETAHVEPPLEPPLPAKAVAAKVEAAPVVEPEPVKPVSAAAGTTASKRDDLQVIEGIGPKIAGALYAAGIETYAHLASMPATDVERIVKTAGVRMVGRA